jgi:hypothetical protein
VTCTALNRAMIFDEIAPHSRGGARAYQGRKKFRGFVMCPAVTPSSVCPAALIYRPSMSY